MELKEQFERAAAESKNLKDRPSNDTLLQMYALYKQANVGDAPDESSATPFDFVAKAKHEAWHSLKGKSKDAAMQQYVELIAKLETSDH